MCACGRSRPEVVTTVQAGLDEQARQEEYARLLAQTVSDAEAYAASAARAIANSSSE